MDTLAEDAGCSDIYGLGESLGASILIQATAREPVFRAIVAECPFADLRAIAEFRVRQVSHVPALVARIVVSAGMIYARLRYGLNFAGVAPLWAISHTTTPILLIHGTSDSRTRLTARLYASPNYRAERQHLYWYFYSGEICWRPLPLDRYTSSFRETHPIWLEEPCTK